MTCDSSIGNADVFNKNLCNLKGLTYMGSKAIVMPENYIAIFHTTAQQDAIKIIQASEPLIQHTVMLIKNESLFKQTSISIIDRVNSNFINKLFYPVFLHAHKFYATDSCISCGKCEKICPLKNIHMSNAKPVWHNKCTHCMACISYCPKEAIEYGKHTKGLERYTCPNM